MPKWVRLIRFIWRLRNNRKSWDNPRDSPIRLDWSEDFPTPYVSGARSSIIIVWLSYRIVVSIVSYRIVSYRQLKYCGSYWLGDTRFPLSWNDLYCSIIIRYQPNSILDRRNLEVGWTSSQPALPLAGRLPLDPCHLCTTIPGERSKKFAQISKALLTYHTEYRGTPASRSQKHNNHFEPPRSSMMVRWGHLGAGSRRYCIATVALVGSCIDSPHRVSLIPKL